jgi:TolA-binding protein
VGKTITGGKATCHGQAELVDVVAAIQAQVSGLETGEDVLQATTQGLRASLTATNLAVATLENETATIASVDAAQAAIVAVKEETLAAIGVMSNQVASLQGDVDALSTQVKTANDQLTKLLAALSSPSVEVEALDAEPQGDAGFKPV